MADKEHYDREGEPWSSSNADKVCAAQGGDLVVTDYLHRIKNPRLIPDPESSRHTGIYKQITLFACLSLLPFLLVFSI